MPQYRYVALTREGEERQGTDEALDREELARRLRRRQLVLVKAQSISPPRVPLSVTVRLVSELAALLDSGVVLERALHLLAEETGDLRFAGVARQLRDGLKRGQSLSEALEHTARFDPLLVPLVRAGEASGQLPRTLAQLEQYYEERHRLHAELLAALAYPAVLLLVSLLSLVSLAIYVIPVFKGLFSQNPGAIPTATRIVFAASDFLIGYGPLLVGVAVATMALSAAMIRTRPQLHARWDHFLLALPLIGPLLALAESGRLLTLLSVLLAGDVPLVRALELARGGMGNRAMRAGLEQAIQGLRQGQPLMATMARVPALPARALQLLTVGDESGRLVQATAKAGQWLSQQLKNRLKALVSLAEPVIILIMGGMIGFVVVSMLLAVFDLSTLSAQP